jgi:hypothetical protein
MLSGAIFSISGQGKLRPFPVTVDHREDLSIDKLTCPDEIALLLRGERLTQPEVVGSQRLTDAVVQIHDGTP